MQQAALVQDLALQGKIIPSQLVSHRAPLAEFPALYRLVCESPEQVHKAIILNPA
jgi:threonine dehydrogenase-like Zn-dependent dehydrogenase